MNSPAVIKKAWEKNPSYDDFNEIRSGIVEDQSTTNTSFSVSCADKYRAMEENAVPIIKAGQFPYDKAVGEELPVIYGSAEAGVIELHKPEDGGANTFDYIIAEYATNVIAYDNDDNVVAGASYNGTTWVLTSPTEVKYVSCRGWPITKIGAIITDLLYRRTELQKNGTNYDMDEISLYEDASPEINILFKGGSIKNAIAECLKSDLAYFIQKNDGRFTLRSYALAVSGAYGTREIPAWSITQ